MLMLIIGMSLLYSYVMSHLHISQGAAQWIVAMQLSKWVLLTVVLLMRAALAMASRVLKGSTGGMAAIAGSSSPSQGAGAASDGAALASAVLPVGKNFGEIPQ